MGGAAVRVAVVGAGQVVDHPGDLAAEVRGHTPGRGLGAVAVDQRRVRRLRAERVDVLLRDLRAGVHVEPVLDDLGAPLRIERVLQVVDRRAPGGTRSRQRVVSG